MWTKPIYDRTDQDILNRTSKAFFNVSDWLRVNGNTQDVKTLVDIMLAIDVPFDDLGAAPQIAEFPSYARINALLGNIDSLRAEARLPAATGVVPIKHNYVPGSGAVAPDYKAVNDWERDLFLIRKLIVFACDYWLYTGTFNCGQTRWLQNGFRSWPHYIKSTSETRIARAGVSGVGQSLTRQNKFRRY